MLALAPEHFWWPRMDDDCLALVRGCQHCKIFEGAFVKAQLCPIQSYTPLELVHVDFTRILSSTSHQVSRMSWSLQITSQSM